jgi:peptidoglycan-associated lipoprotein
MLKHLFIIMTIFSLASCAGKSKSSMIGDQTQVFDPKDEQVEEYQTVDESQASELNAAEEQKIEEVEVTDRVLFGYDSFSLTDEAKKVLDTQVAWLKSDLNIKVTIEGHADERGTREYNIALGEKRAKSVRDYLVKNGIDTSRLAIVSYGKERPAFYGTDEAIHAKNRRAVTVIN